MVGPAQNNLLRGDKSSANLGIYWNSVPQHLNVRIYYAALVLKSLATPAVDQHGCLVDLGECIGHISICVNCMRTLDVYRHSGSEGRVGALPSQAYGLVSGRGGT